jgi:hypothetical protein
LVLSLSGDDAAHFGLQNDACSQQILNPGQSCAVEIIFAPLSAGQKTAMLSLLTNNDTLVTNIGVAGLGIEAATPTPTATATATLIPTETPTPTNTPTPIDTPTPTFTPTPTDTPTTEPTVTPTVTPGAVTIEELIATLDDYCEQGQIDNQGVCNSLRVKLTKAQDYINQGKVDKAISELETFINKVEAQRGKHITVEAADHLIDIAEQLIAVLQA